MVNPSTKEGEKRRERLFGDRSKSLKIFITYINTPEMNKKLRFFEFFLIFKKISRKSRKSLLFYKRRWVFFFIQLEQP